MKKKLSVLFVVIAAIALCMGVTACAAKNYTVTFTGEGVTETTQTVAEGGTVIAVSYTHLDVYKRQP